MTEQRSFTGGWDEHTPVWTWHRDDLPPVSDGHTLVYLEVRETEVAYPVVFPRVPNVGERIMGPDDMGSFEIIEVLWDFAHGFSWAPMPVVVARRDVSPDEPRDAKPRLGRAGASGPGDAEPLPE